MKCSVDTPTLYSVRIAVCSVLQTQLHCTGSGLQWAGFYKHSYIVQCQVFSVKCSVDIATLYNVRIAVCSCSVDIAKLYSVRIAVCSVL